MVRKCSVSNNDVWFQVDYIDSIIKLIKDEEEKESGETPTKSKKKKSKELKDPEEERTRYSILMIIIYQG